MCDWMNKATFLRFITLILLSGCTREQSTGGSSTGDRPTGEQSLTATISPSYEAAEKWFLRNVRDNGLFHYLYYPNTDAYPNKNNAIRQLMASRLLAELSNEKPELLSLHERNLAFLLKFWRREEGDLAYIFYDSKSKLGANAMMLRTLVWSPHYERYQRQAKKFADGILSLMDKKGAFHPWFKEPDYAYDKDYLLTFYSGEALLALAEYYEKTKDKRYLDHAVKAQDFYVDRYVNHIEQNYYPAYVPWHTMSLNKLWKITKKQTYLDAIFTLNNKLLELQDTTKHIGRFFNPATPQYGTPHVSSDGVYTEGLAYAYEIAKLSDNGELQQRYRQALIIAVENLITLQYNEQTAAKYNNPNRAIGAFKYSADRSGIRIDSVQHAMDAYRKIMEVEILKASED